MDSTLPNQIPVPGPPVHRVPLPRIGPRHGLWANINPSALTAQPAQAPTPSQPAPAVIRSAEHLAVLEDVLSRTDEIEQLLTTYAALQERRGELATELQTSDPSSVQALWQEAVTAFDAYLSQSIHQGKTGQTVNLMEAVDTFRHWVASVRDNARGSGGEAIQDSPERLEKLLGRMTDLEPSINQLLQDAAHILSNPRLEVSAIHKLAEARAAEATQATLRQSELAAATSVLTCDIGPRLATLRSSIASRMGVLRGLADNSNSSTDLTAEARTGIRDFEQIDVESLETRLGSIQEWVSKYASDPTLTAAVITHRIEQELDRPLTQAETQLAELEIQYQPSELTRAETERQHAQFATLSGQVAAQLTVLRSRYQTLVTVRRQKLGSEPDERYYGAVAKEVNDAISLLGQQENDLLSLSADLTGAHIDSYTSLRGRVLAQTEAVRELLGQSDRFATNSALETTLTDAWKHVLRPIQLLLTQATEHIERSKGFLLDAKDHPGLSDSVRAHIQTLTDSLTQSAQEARTFVASAEQATGSNRSQLAVGAKAHQRDLERTLKEFAPLASREQFQALLSDEVLQAQLAAEALRAEQERAEQQARARLPEQLQTLLRSRTRLIDRVRHLLGYATALEPIEPNRAEQYYGQLDTVLSLPLDLPALDCRTLGQALNTPAAWQQLEKKVQTADFPFRPLDLTVSQLEVLLGPAGRLTQLLSELETQAGHEPLSRFQSLTRRRKSIKHTLEQATTQLATLDAERLTAATGVEQTEDAYKAERAGHELRRIGTELGRVRALLSSAEREHLAGAETLLAEALDTAQRATEDLAALAARQAVQRKTTEKPSDATAKRHRLREKLQATLVEQSLPAQSIVIASQIQVPEPEPPGGEELTIDAEEAEEVSIPVHHGPMTNNE